MPTATISGTPDQLTVTVKINNSTTGPKNAGTYTAVASITNANYTLKADTRETTFVISPKEITATFTNTTPTYNGQVQKPGVTFTGLVNGENANATVAITNGNGIDAGTHTATVTIANQNYKLTGTTSTNFTIAKKVITASFGNTTVTYNGQAQKPTVTFDNTVSGKAPQYTLKVGNSTAQTNAGTYTATVTLSETGNYTFANGLLTASTTFTVTAAQK